MIASHKTLVNVPISRNLINAYWKSHNAYKIALDKSKQQKTNAALLGKRQLPVINEVSQMKENKKKLEDKQQQTEKMILEGT